MTVSENKHAGAGLCRLCGGRTHEVFQLTVLQRHRVAYHKCGSCLSMQTDEPYWLDEAYGSHITSLDTGALQRNLNIFAFCYGFCRIFGVQTAVDYGGADGLLCRFLRDHGVDAYVLDRYGKPTYAQGFSDPVLPETDLVTAFEVLEHLGNPGHELEDIFASRPKYLLCTTEIFSDQGKDWRYLAPEAGQHVFFYSVLAIQYIADRYGYKVAPIGQMILFYRADLPDQTTQIISAQSVLTGWVFQAVKAYVPLMPTPGVEKDFFAAKEALQGEKTNF